jgi:hypothetical protein
VARAAKRRHGPKTKLESMEGPAVLHSAWLLCAAFIWVYHRYFATVAGRSLEFERYCATRPVVARLLVGPGNEPDLSKQLRIALGPRSEVIPTLAGWPWTHHVLKLELACTPGIIQFAIVGCRVQRLRERALPALTDFLLEVMQNAQGRVAACWLCSEAFRDVLGEVTSDAGWRLVPERPRTQCVEPFGAPCNSLVLQPSLPSAPLLATTSPSIENNKTAPQIRENPAILPAPNAS